MVVDGIASTGAVSGDSVPARAAPTVTEVLEFIVYWNCGNPVGLTPTISGAPAEPGMARIVTGAAVAGDALHQRRIAADVYTDRGAKKNPGVAVIVMDSKAIGAGFEIPKA